MIREAIIENGKPRVEVTFDERSKEFIGGWKRCVKNLVGNEGDCLLNDLTPRTFSPSPLLHNLM